MTSLIGVQPRQGVACQDRIARRKSPFFCSMRPLLGIGIREGPTESRNKEREQEGGRARFCSHANAARSVSLSAPSFRCKVRQFIITFSSPFAHPFLPSSSFLIALSPLHLPWVHEAEEQTVISGPRVMSLHSGGDCNCAEPVVCRASDP